MDIRTEVKILLAKECTTLVKVAEELSKRTNKNVNADNISQKLTRGRMKINEVEEILDALGYELVIKKKD